MTFSSTLTIS